MITAWCIFPRLFRSVAQPYTPPGTPPPFGIPWGGGGDECVTFQFRLVDLVCPLSDHNKENENWDREENKINNYLSHYDYNYNEVKISWHTGVPRNTSCASLPQCIQFAAEMDCTISPLGSPQTGHLVHPRRVLPYMSFGCWDWFQFFCWRVGGMLSCHGVDFHSWTFPECYTCFTFVWRFIHTKFLRRKEQQISFKLR
jgi:hypothetical protein